MSFLEKSFAYLDTIVSSGNEMLVVVAACVLSMIGFIVLYTKGPWLGLPLSLAGILVIFTAILAKFWNYFF